MQIFLPGVFVEQLQNATPKPQTERNYMKLTAQHRQYIQNTLGATITEFGQAGCSFHTARSRFSLFRTNTGFIVTRDGSPFRTHPQSPDVCLGAIYRDGDA